MGLRPNADKEQFWLDHVRRWQVSQLTVRQFCRRHRLREGNFYAWRRVLLRRGLLDNAPNAPAFVKLAVDREPPAPTTPVEIVLSERRVVRVRAGFDADLLLQLVQLLEEPGC
jgi:hypothetical protein